MKKIYLFALLLSPLAAFAQNDDLLSMLGDEETTDFTTATFKANRVVNGHSVENTAKGVLDTKFSHRFNPLRNGIYDVFGLDGASIRIGADYGVTDRFMIGFGRSSYEKTIDGFAKYKILRQSSGKKNMPVTLSYLIDAQIRTVKFSDIERDNKFSDRLFFTHQVLIGRKFNSRLSLQLMPTLVHRNLTTSPNDKNDVYVIGAAGRVKLTKRITLNAEYYYVPEGQLEADYANSLSVGFDIETGGHVFQLHFTNSPYMTHKAFITETTEDWFFKNGDGKMLSGIRFGFNISRVFTIVKPKLE
ncbi:MAG: DUF5777 family beta-barrel protein [Saprospiraceae bacterium]|nr:DUF5777 family beta-barrel protein [Saprospiraceae bacterium]